MAEISTKKKFNSGTFDRIEELLKEVQALNRKMRHIDNGKTPPLTPEEKQLNKEYNKICRYAIGKKKEKK